MPNLAAVLKEEIRRLARKEIRAHVVSARKAAVQCRREIAALKRKIEQQQRQIAALESRQQRRTAEPVAPQGSVEAARFSIRSVKSQRRRLGLSAEEFGKLIRVSGQTVYNWEQGRTRPGRAQFTALVQLRKIGRREAMHRLASIDAS